MHGLKVKKIRYKNLLRIVFYAIATVLIGITNSNHLELALVTLGLFSLFVVAKFSYFTVFSFILWFSFLQEFFASISPALSSGRLAWVTTVPIYHRELFICVMIFYISELFIFFTTNVLTNEKEVLKTKLNITKRTAEFYALCAFLMIILAYPSLPRLQVVLMRDEGFLPSSFVVPLASIVLSICFDYYKESILCKLITLLSMFWVFFHGDRVIVLGFMVYVILKYMNDGTHNYKTLKSVIFNKRTIIIFACAIVVGLFAIKIEFSRTAGIRNLTVLELLTYLLKQGTAGDVVFAFNCSVDMWISGNGTFGHTYLYYLSNILPGADQSLNPAVVLYERYDTGGGGLFFSEPMINGGIILTIVHTLVFLYFVVFILSRKKKYSTFYFIPIVILIFRFTWYANLAGLVKCMLYYVPALYVGARKIRLR